jgi:hypothetical protein
MRSTLFGILVLGLAVGAAASLEGAEISIDNFNHGNPALPGWTLVDMSAEQPWGPGVYDPTSGALRIYHSGSELVPPGTPFTSTAMFALWNNSVDPLYAEGYLQAKIRTDQVQNSTSVAIRTDLSTATGYLLFGFTKSPASMPELDGTFLMSKFVNGVETGIWQSGIEYLPGEDWIVEIGAVGARITGKVWRAGDLEPSAPQFNWVDPDPITSGMIAISSDKTIGNTIPTHGDSTFDDMVFNPVPEPATSVLLFAGLLAVLPWRSLR